MTHYIIDRKTRTQVPVNLLRIEGGVAFVKKIDREDVYICLPRKLVKVVDLVVM